MHAKASFRNVSKFCVKTHPEDKSNPQFSVNVGSDLDQEGQDLVGQGTIHVGSGGPKFSERYWTFDL